LNVCALSLALALSAEPAGTAELKSSLEIVNRTGNQDYFILAWKLTEGEPKSVTYTVQVSDENGNRSWKNIRGLAGTERQAALFIGETGHTYRFRSLARGDSGAEEVKSHDQSDATAKFGTPPQDISFGVNPYPLCPNWGGAYIPYVPLSLIRGEYIHMAFGYFTNGKEKFSRGDVVIEVPEGVRIVGATYMPYFNRETNEIPIYHCGAIKRGKKRYNVHFVPNTPKVEGRYYGYRHILRVYFAPESGYDGGDKFHWFPIQDGVAGKRVSADIEVLPELPASKTPKHFDYHILHQTDCQPYLVQAVCYELVQELNKQERRRATMEDIEHACAKTLEAGSAFFGDLYGQIGQGLPIIEALLTRGPTPAADLPLHHELERMSRQAIVTESSGLWRLRIPLFETYLRSRLL